MRLTLSSFFLFIVTITIGSAQEFQDQLLGNFQDFQEKHYTEKIYLHTDRDYYITGEILWYSIYCTNNENQFSDLSSVVYVELLDKDNKAVIQQKIGIENGQGSGSFYLPVSLNNNQYTLRAYTRWMRNFSPDYFFHKPIAIANTFIGNSQNSLLSKKYDVQFLPEGGHLLVGQKNRLAFKVTDASGKGLNATGIITNSKNDTLLSFRDSHLGMGSFKFTPKNGENYKAKLVINEDTILRELPVAKKEGYMLNVNQQDDALNIVGLSTLNEPFLTFFVHTNGLVVKSVTINTQSGKSLLSIPLEDLGTGINHITLFNSRKEVVAERLFFHYGAIDKLTEVSISQKKAESRQALSVAIKNLSQQKSRYSISIFLKDSLDNPEKLDIRSWLLLQSNLSGYIENPQYYFNDIQEDTKKAMEALMLTQGWRKFEWSDVLLSKSLDNVILPELEGPFFEAKIIDKETGEAGNWVETYLSFPGKNFRFYAQKSDKNGYLRYVLRNVEGPESGILTGFTETDSTWRFELISSYDTSKSVLLYPPLIIDKSLKNTLETRSISMQAQNIYLDKKLHQFIPVTQDTIPFYGKVDQRYLLDDYTRFPTMEEVMREYVPRVAVRKNKDQYRFKVFDILDETYFNERPLMLLDGMPILNTNDILAFDPFKIKSLDVVSRRFLTNKVDFKGIVSYRTYDGDYSWQKPNKDDFVFDYEGLQEKRIFYQPAYGNSQNLNSKFPDFRTLLFWNPNVILNGSEQKEITFFTSDKKGECTVIIQGLSQGGNPIYEEINFSVEAISN